jgi:hypothetical protein
VICSVSGHAEAGTFKAPRLGGGAEVIGSDFKGSDLAIWFWARGEDHASGRPRWSRSWRESMGTELPS